MESRFECIGESGSTSRDGIPLQPPVKQLCPRRLFCSGSAKHAPIRPPIQRSAESEASRAVLAAASLEGELVSEKSDKLATGCCPINASELIGSVSATASGQQNALDLHPVVCCKIVMQRSFLTTKLRTK